MSHAWLNALGRIQVSRTLNMTEQIWFFLNDVASYHSSHYYLELAVGFFFFISFENVYIYNTFHWYGLFLKFQHIFKDREKKKKTGQQQLTFQGTIYCKQVCQAQAMVKCKNYQPHDHLEFLMSLNQLVKKRCGTGQGDRS